jgi:hypothetical protein
VTNERKRRVSERAWPLEVPMFEYAPLLIPQFFIGVQSLKDAWVSQLRWKKKILVTNKVKEEFQEIGSQNERSLNLKVTGDTQSSREP